MERENKQPGGYLFDPVLTDGERATIILQMSKAAYEAWAKGAGINRRWEDLPVDERGRWSAAVRASVRVMFNLMVQITEET